MKKNPAPTSAVLTPRPPVVAVVGHIDHGKSTLLDYLRKTNVVAGEAGGITQRLSAYEVVRDTATGPRTITFLDTPGHEAFAAMRSRGLSAADIAILVISAEDGAKPQTVEAAKAIEAAGIPSVVAFTKIDKEGADIDRAKNSLFEHGIYLEGLGGTLPWVGVSSKKGTGIPELLDLILLTADISDITADENAVAEGLVIEAHVDPKRGASATLIIKNGTLESGQYVVAEESMAPVRIMENFLGKAVKTATAGHAVRIVGFSPLPAIGSLFTAVDGKKKAEEMVAEARVAQSLQKAQAARPVATAAEEGADDNAPQVVPIVIKTDAAGSYDAIVHEMAKLPEIAKLERRIVSSGVGAVSEADVRFAGSGERPGIIIAFGVKTDGPAQSLAERLGVTIASFDIIYKIGEWLGEELERRRPRQRAEERTGSAKVLKVFSTVKNMVVLGGRVEEGELRDREEVRIMRRDEEVGRGTIESLQSQKNAVKKIEAGTEFGAMIKTNTPVGAGDHLEVFVMVMK